MAAHDFDPLILETSVLWMTLCVPAAWSDYQVVSFSEEHNPSESFAGWRIRDRVPCQSREGFAEVKVTV